MTLDQQQYHRTEVRRRAVREDVKRGRDAKAIVRSLNLQIGAWQEAVAKLASSGEWNRTHGRLDENFAVEVAELRRTIETARQQFVSELEELPAAMRQHGRVEDTLKALDTVLAGLDRAARLTAQ